MDYTEPWEPVQNQQEQLLLVQELRNELTSQAVLFGHEVQAVARRIDCDKVLFAVHGNNTELRLAVVHLTWSGKKEALPWPKIQLFASQQEFLDKQMIPDATEYNS